MKYFPTMMMRKAPDSDSSGYDEEPPMEIGKHVSLCDGMGCGAMAMEAAQLAYDGYFAYELNPTARKIAKHACPAKDSSLGNDVMYITE